MAVVALAAVGSGGSVVLGIGAVGFAASDISVARKRFRVGWLQQLGLGLPAYFLSQQALACSVTHVPHTA